MLMYHELHFALSPTPLPSGEGTVHRLPGRALEGLWCAGHDPNLQGDPRGDSGKFADLGG